jgi:hypothetical protein
MLVLSTAANAPDWTELRDDRGALYARVQPRTWLLEVHRNGRTVVFRLSDYLREELQAQLPEALNSR